MPPPPHSDPRVVPSQDGAPLAAPRDVPVAEESGFSDLDVSTPAAARASSEPMVPYDDRSS